MLRWILLIILQFLVLPVIAATAEVNLPLSQYQQLLEKTQAKVNTAAYALGKAKAELVIEEKQHHWSALVTLHFDVQIYDNEWTSVPLLPVNTALLKAMVKRQQIQLSQQGEQLYWSTRKAGTYAMTLQYQLDVRQDVDDLILALPLPPVPTTMLTAVFPGSNIQAAVIPAITLETDHTQQQTTVQATIPYVTAVQVSWHAGLQQGYLLSRVHYKGEQQKDVVLWQADFKVQNFSSKQLKIPLLAANTTLSDVMLDGQPATILVEDQQFAVLLQGRGTHTISARFQTSINTEHGPPKLIINTPKIPVSYFELVLSGNKQLNIVPKTHVAYSQQDDKQTLANFYSPMTQQVVVTWLEAVPEAEIEPVRANASLYHAVHAEEGVLHGRAIVNYDITRGETNSLEIIAPINVQINRISSKQGSISDWRNVKDQQQQTINIFLDRKVKGKYQFMIEYEQLFNSKTQEMTIPLLRAAKVHRQRGMLALLSSAELSLKPMTSQRMSKVGENQLPDFVRKRLKMTVAHTYKYTDSAPILMAKAVAPERKAGKFDVQIDTLLSIGEVTLKGVASIEFNVKSGSLMALDLALPKSVNLLGLTGPSVRTHRLKDQQIEVEFTREMKGQFRLQLHYEQILTDVGETIVVPTVRVAAAEVEHGRIAVEALAAVEVQAAQLDNLSSLELNELPRQLILQTANPILLAYRYVNPPYQLSLKITRHKELDVQVAVIEKATYQTLLTHDGLAVTTARYQVKNSRKQFLRLELPDHAEIWSLQVGGREEKPAKAEKSKNSVLIKMINSTNGFPIELVYVVRVPKLQYMGEFSMQLAKPNIIVTASDWQVYVPSDLYYNKPESNMTLGYRGRWISQANMQQKMQGLKLSVPAQGKHFSFNKLYANQSKENTTITLSYVNQKLYYAGQVLITISTMLIGIGTFWLATAWLKAILITWLPSVMLMVYVVQKLAVNPIMIAYNMGIVSIVLLCIVLIRYLRHRRCHNIDNA